MRVAAHAVCVLASIGACGGRGTAPPDSVLVPAGDYVVGGRIPGTEPSRPTHVAEFRLDRWPVDLDAFARWVDSPGGRPREGAEAPSGAGRDPATGIEWDAAEAFCRARGGRLPTEAEWEAAAAGPEHRTFPWGNDWDAARVDAKARWWARIGAHPSGAAACSAEDMVGAVFHWTRTPVEGGDPDSPEWRGPRLYVVKGGAPGRLPAYQRVAWRSALDLHHRSPLVGFRCAWSEREPSVESPQQFTAEAFDRSEATRQLMGPIFVLGTLHHVRDPDLEPLLAALSRALIPGGRLLLADADGWPAVAVTRSWLTLHGFALLETESYDEPIATEPGYAIARAAGKTDPAGGADPAHGHDFAEVWRKPDAER